MSLKILAAKLTYTEGMSKQNKEVVCTGRQEFGWQNDDDPHAALNDQPHDAVRLKLETTNQVSILQAELEHINIY